MKLLSLVELLQAAVPSGNGSTSQVVIIASSISGGFVALGKLVDYVATRYRDRRRDVAENASLDEAVQRISRVVEDGQKRSDLRFEGIERQVLTLTHHIVGPDGENGIRGDVREVKARVIGLEERERQRLERSYGAKDRRSEL